MSGGATMQEASGFLASDGRFFFSAEECIQYESELARVSGIRDRCSALICAIRVGDFKNIPEHMQECLAEAEDCFEEVWNEVLVPLLVPSTWDGDISVATPHELAIFEKKLGFVRLVVSYLLEGSA
jgi:hypothetical protein